MHYKSVIGLLLIILPCLIQAYPGQVVHKIPAPYKFTTGLTWDGGNLWIADYKADKLTKLDAATGSVLMEIPSPGYWPGGLAWDGKHLWNADSKQHKIYKLDPSDGTVLMEFDAPTANASGLTWDGTTLWTCDSRKNMIMKLDLSDGTAIRRYDAPAKSPQGLTFDGRYLWCSDRTTDEIYMIDPENGAVIMILDAPGPYSRGLAFDGTHLWNTDYQNDSLYQIVQQDDELYSLKNTRRSKVYLTHEVTGFGTGLIKELDTYIAIPRDLPQQNILNVTFRPSGFRKEQDHWNQPFAVFHREDIPSATLVQSIMEVEAEISEIRYYIDPDRCGTLSDIPEDIRKLYTADGSKYRTSDPFIRETVAKIAGDEQNPYWIARRFFDYVGKTLEYKMEGGWNVAPFVLQRGTGSCSEYTFSFISLCRAAGVPARYVGAIVVRGDDASLDESFHRWPEVYLPNYGWIPMDPQGGDKPSPRDQASSIGGLSNRFLITTQGGGDSEYIGWYYNYHQKYIHDPQLKVHVEVFGEWEPLPAVVTE